jgi:streptogramin lyase
MKEAAFIAGGTAGRVLNAPKGMAVLRKTLYVADIDTIRAYSLPEGREKGSLRLKEMRAQFLNDVAVMGDKVYVTDTFGKRVFEADPGLRAAKVLAELKEQPNGIAACPDNKALLVVTWGPGKILRLDTNGAVSTYFDGAAHQLADLDGIVIDKTGAVIFSSFTRGAIYRLTPTKELAVIASDLTSPADIGIDARGRILIPLMDANKAAVLTFETKAVKP